MKREEALELLNTFAEGISRFFGRSCESAVYDMDASDRTVLAIYNNHVSGREIGSAGGRYADETLNLRRTDAEDHADYAGTVVVCGEKKIKSMLFCLRGDDGYCLGLGIHYDITALATAQSALEELAGIESYVENALAAVRHHRLEDIFEDCVHRVGKPLRQMKKGDRIALVALLKEARAFDFQKAVPYISDKLGVSRFTIYNYLKYAESPAV